ncbi:M20 family peptidase [Ramlibacter sp. USB13]|uniref:M20 family peptidase n=1 Tax=Ramlibacter cellulosilyticus TaxID=2764187 RepID=A0A923MUT6_9BURK|nr:M20 family peptidase [Ramlibacter cellulosilyticus]MBC5786257.1 M20 family peptidase [Ramlibacter cellulosilyticus]
MAKRVLLLVFAVLLLLVAAVGVNTWRQGSRQVDVAPAPPLAIDNAAVADKLATLIRFQTVSSDQDPALNTAEFRKLHAALEQRFPLVHARLKREFVGGLSLLYTWQGSDPAAKPIALMAHHDVAPIAAGTEGQWEEPPFAGVVKGGYVWGRGAWDDKGNLVAQLEAVEMLLASGFQPRQTVYIVSGADEEVAGLRGAAPIAKLLQERGVRLDFVIDEGLVLTEGVVAGVAAPAALIGVAEKGYVTVQLKAVAQPGHASMPPPPGTTAIAQIGAALQRLDEQQFPPRLKGVARDLFATLAPEMQGFQRVALANLWLFGPLVEKQLAKAPSTNAMLRTTTALTIVNAGNKHNVIPGQAEAIIDFRILPGDSVSSVLQHVRDKAGAGIEVNPVGGSKEPTPVSSTEAASYRVMERTLRSVFPGTIVAPALYVAGSDSQHFVPIADSIYRFSPVRARPSDLPRLHGTNERISVANLGELVRFYHQLLRNLNAPAP